ncbi:MAG: AAA family ATPase [Acetobacteraceae bacterium]
MDPRRNPYAPGAGSPPPILAGRDDLVAGAELALARVRAGRHAKSFIAVGLRGVGKTVILNKVQDLADELGYQSVYIEAYDDVALPDALSKGLRPALLRLDRMAGAQDVARRGLRILRSFAGTFRVSIQGFDLSIAPEEGTADTGDLATDLTELMLAVGQAAAAQRTSVALILDEIQYLAERDLAPLIMAMHRVNQKQLPLVLFAAGLPQVRGQMGEAKSYVERLFDFPAVDALDANDARRAVAEPARSQGIEFTEEALDEIVRVTAGYPYFLQEWGHFVWRQADTSPIPKAVVLAAHDAVIRQLDTSFFRVRLDRMTPTEKRYMRAMAELGPGAHRSGDIARVYGAKVTSVAPIRSALISKGMIFSPAHGDTAFTVPLFDDFMRREIPALSSLARG